MCGDLLGVRGLGHSNTICRPGPRRPRTRPGLGNTDRETHQRFEDSGYDCSGTVSYALHAGDLLESALDSGSFMKWGRRGKGRWITVYTHTGHAYVVIAGLRLDTSGGDRQSAEDRLGGRGPRWRKYSRKPAGFVARHPANY